MCVYVNAFVGQVLLCKYEDRLTCMDGPPKSNSAAFGAALPFTPPSHFAFSTLAKHYPDINKRHKYLTHERLIYMINNVGIYTTLSYVFLLATLCERPP